MEQITITFTECEHRGDLNNYIGDLVEAGARILSSNVNHDTEEGNVCVEVSDREAFDKAFKATDSYNFSSLSLY